MPRQPKPSGTPPPLGTVWVATAKIQIIDKDTMRWRTLIDCMDTPKAVATAVAKVRSNPANASAILWIRDCLGDRYIYEK